MFRFILICAALWLSTPLVCAQPATELTPDNFVAWRQHILPSDRELGWMEIPWLTTFADGIAAANSADKPMLLWTMNGHPLGCT